MPVFEINLSGVRTFDPLPNDIYDCVIQSYKPIESEFGTQFIYTFAIEKPAQFAKRTFTDNVALTQKGLWKLKSILRVVGYPHDQLEGVIRFDPQSIVGCPIRIKVENSSVKGGPVYPHPVQFLMSDEVRDIVESQQTNGTTTTTTPAPTIQPQSNPPPQQTVIQPKPQTPTPTQAPAPALPRRRPGF